MDAEIKARNVWGRNEVNMDMIFEYLSEYSEEERNRLRFLEEKCEIDNCIGNPDVYKRQVWRSAGNSDNFHVTLMRLPYDDAEDFKPFNSEGAWSATIVEGGDDFITLRSTVEGSGSDNAQQTGVKSIEGAGEHPIDFWIDFKGTIPEGATPRDVYKRQM